jgi:hypothetical protein
MAAMQLEMHHLDMVEAEEVAEEHQVILELVLQVEMVELA